MAKKSLDLFKQMAAKAQGKEVSALTGTDLANYFLSNGVQYKGQCQTGVLASGYGATIGVALNAGLASLEANVTGDALSQSVLIVQHGPGQLAGETLGGPISLQCMIGRQWRGNVSATVNVGLCAEVGWSFGSAGPESTATHTFKDEPEDSSTSAEIFGASASAFAGLKIDASAQLDHYWGFDPAPSYYHPGRTASAGWSGTHDLCVTLADTLDGKTRERALHREALSLINGVRDGIMVFAAGDKALEKTVKERFAVWFTTVGANEHVTSLSTAEIVSILTTFGLPENKKIRWHLCGGTAASDIVDSRARDLLRRFQPFLKRSSEALCWLRMRSAKLQLGGSVVVVVNAGARTPRAALEAEASANLAAAGGVYHRTGIRWQTQLATSEAGALLCTQETSITYTSLSARALEVGVSADAKVGPWRGSAEASRSVGSKDLNLMSYVSATLYWRAVAGASSVPAQPGSGVSFGQSFVVKNLVRAIAASKADPPTRWIVRMAERLRVSPKVLMNFLKTPLVTELLADLRSSSQSTESTETWEDRAVLVEASFALQSPPAVAVKDCVPQDLSVKLAAQRGALQSLRLRFRISDYRSSEKNWTLGFKILGTGMSVGLRSLANAGAEGIVDLCTIWFNADGTVSDIDGEPAYQREDAVPPVTLFCQ